MDSIDWSAIGPTGFQIGLIIVLSVVAFIPLSISNSFITPKIKERGGVEGSELDRRFETMRRLPLRLTAVAFSPDGRTLASASANLIRIWDAETGQPLYTLPGHTRAVSDIEFSLDGSRLASTSADGTVRIFVMPVEELMDLARSRLTRSLTDAECRRYLHAAPCAAVQ